MECHVLITHGANKKAVTHQTLEIGADVSCPVLVPIERNHAVSLCAAPQTPYLKTHCRLLLFPWPAGAETVAARL